ncbi:MAG: carboxypeptidase regulatory-like domain-containing protein [Gemmatimonadetes bacterium]|nr:carboxypeptidase regulatory-like domain-containing protein [Gemmatimonadota bacterium]
MARSLSFVVAIFSCALILIGAGCGNEVTAPDVSASGNIDSSKQPNGARYNPNKPPSEVLVDGDMGMVVVNGTVTPAVSATIRAYRPGGNVLVAETMTNAEQDGFSLSLKPGRYDMVASAGGFEEQWKYKVKVRPDRERTVHFVLQDSGEGGE